MEKSLRILEGILEVHFCRRNYLNLPMCGPKAKDKDGEFIWKPCECETCVALTKVVKRLKKVIQDNAKPDSTTPSLLE